MRLSQRSGTILMAALMASILSLIMSFTMDSINVGFVSYFFMVWMRDFLIAFLVSFPSTLLFQPVLMKLIDKWVDKKEKLKEGT